MHKPYISDVIDVIYCSRITYACIYFSMRKQELMGYSVIEIL